MKNIKFIITLLFSAILVSFSKKETLTKKLVDIAEVKIGTQTWSSSNLDVNSFRNGDLIQEAKSMQEWKKASEERTPAWCYYDIDSENGKTYGKLYNWYAVNDPRKLAPKGWHIPNEAEWNLLADFLGGKKIVSTKLKSSSGWTDEKGKATNGTNESGFNALPAGNRSYFGEFFDKGKVASWWGADEVSSESSWARELNNNLKKVYYFKHTMVSVRCIKD